jgi:hypothetical protein
MNKKFSTLLAGILLAGSFSSTYAQLDNARKVELEKFKEGRAYYLAGTHEDSGNSYFQAFALANPVNAAYRNCSNYRSSVVCCKKCARTVFFHG